MGNLGIRKKVNQIEEMIAAKQARFNNIRWNTEVELHVLLDDLSKSDVKSIENFIKYVHDRHYLAPFFRNSFDVHYDPTSSILLVEFDFPDYERRNLVTGYGKSGGYADRNKPKFASATAKRKIVKETLYSLIIREAYLAAKFLPRFLAESVVVNVQQDWFDPATGQPRRGTIASVQAPVDYLVTLDTRRLDPIACVRHLKGIVTTSLENINPVRPILVLDRNDDRLVESKDVDQSIDEESNLAAMPWEDFEHLVAQLFEWEFKKGGVEVRVTRASRDRGVDAILFDPDPLRGGKYVLQAKRYTRTVDVAAVRDLYGTVMNEGANRGILITTSSYGPDAYEFAKDKAMSLVDGPNLLQMLQKHGKKFRIDLDEARRLYGEE